MGETNENAITMDEICEMNIFEKLAAITAELQTVAKNVELTAGGGKYKAVSERDIIDAVKPLEEKYRVYSYPSGREILEAQMLQSESTYNNKTTTKTTFFTRIMTTYRFVNIDDPKDFIETVTFAEGIDTQDKGSGKAMTYADKYALMKAYKISTGEDPDYNPSNPDNYTTQPQQQPQKPQYGNQNGWQPSPQQAPQNGPQQDLICAGCGSMIKDATLKDGGIMKALEVARFAVGRYGKPYCSTCQTKMANQQTN